MRGGLRRPYVCCMLLYFQVVYYGRCVIIRWYKLLVAKGISILRAEYYCSRLIVGDI